MHDKDLPGITRGWAARTLATGKLAASAAQLAARRIVGVEGTRDGQLGLDLARELDQMKGMAMKVGQILSYFDGVLPEETHKALRSLQQGAQPVAFSVMKEVLEQGLGASLEQLFEDFDARPIAAASIGQVYRARFQGQTVAVKVQYPQIRQTMDADFDRLGSLASLATLFTAVDGKALISELKERVDAECDYVQEAAHLRAFAAAFAQDSAVHIPAPLLERTCGTVLSTEWCDGRSFYAFLENSSQAQRNDAGLRLARFAFQSLFGLGAINADPHPGNYLFPEDGSLVFLDFGCVRHFEPAFLEPERRLARVVVENQRPAFADALLATGLVSRPERFDFDFHWRLLRHQYAPFCVPRFRYSSGYVRAGLEFSGPKAPNMRELAIPPAWIWLQRLQWGLHAVLARLEAEGDFQSVFEQALAMPLCPLEPG